MKIKNNKTIKNTKNNIKSVPKKLNNLGQNINNIFRNLIKFLQSTFYELKNVEWLSRKEVFKFSSYIMIFLIISAVGIALLDLIFYKLLLVLIENK